MHEVAYRNDAQGRVWFTIAQAAAFTGRAVQTIYSWERRHILTNPRHDEHGRRIYSQQQIAAAERTVRARHAAARQPRRLRPGRSATSREVRRDWRSGSAQIAPFGAKTRSRRLLPAPSGGGEFYVSCRCPPPTDAAGGIPAAAGLPTGSRAGVLGVDQGCRVGSRHPPRQHCRRV
ncbi:MerR family transcriptional regulator [Streptomyces hoynatensis]|uniref:MerR family transcriptional regulator n=1 Tax=Streptomyces hoynatensis TaxID=1141874 RepID=A0A3A9Z0M8_9ACTN|nr:MerR family transcriptional regulator [Streptomyces hoynatensis]